MRRSLWERVGPFDTRFRNTGDYDMYARCRAVAAPLILKEVIGRFRLHGDQLSFRPEVMAPREPSGPGEERDGPARGGYAAGTSAFASTPATPSGSREEDGEDPLHAQQRLTGARAHRARIIGRPASGRARTVRIGVDASFIDPGRVGGAEHMLTNLVEGLARHRASGRRPGRLHRPSVGRAPRSAFGPLTGSGNRFTRITWTLRGVLDALRRRAVLELLHRAVPPHARRPRFVTVIHDLQYLHFPEHFSRQKRLVAGIARDDAPTRRRDGRHLARRPPRHPHLGTARRWAPACTRSTTP